MARTPWDLGLYGAPSFRLRLVDLVLNYLLFTPLVVLFWHGTEGVLDLALPAPESVPWLGAVFALVLGTGIQTAASAAQSWIPARALPPPNTDLDSVLLHGFVARLYNYAVALGTVLHYRGVGQLYGYVAGDSLLNGLRAASTGLLALWGVRCGRNVLGPPLYLDLDSGQDFYYSPTLFRTEPDLSKYNLLDNVATVLVVHTCAHLHWNGVWMFLDQVLPSNQCLSMVICIVIGYTITTTFLCIQHRASKLSQQLEEKSNFVRIAFEDFFIFAANLGCIIAWRGLWDLFDISSLYFPIYHKGRDVTPVATNILSFSLLCVAMISNTLSAKGVEIDGELEDGEGVLFATDYFYEYLHDDLAEMVQLKAAVSKNESLKRVALQQTAKPGSKATATVMPITRPTGNKPEMTSSMCQTKSGASMDNTPGSTGSVRRKGISRNTIINPDAAIGRHNVGTGKSVSFGQNFTNGKPDPTSSQHRPAFVVPTVSANSPAKKLE